MRSIRMDNIIAPGDKDLILSELTRERFLRTTNKGDNEIYIVNAVNSPNTMREIGRLREIAFRDAGGGTGKSCDIDRYDTMEKPCEQLIVWNPQAQEIVGGYRYIIGKDIKIDAQGKPDIATSHLFNFSREFIERYLPRTIELGRSFVSLPYQSRNAGAKALYALDNLWDGLAALTVVNPEIEYLFGKVTMYPTYDTLCRDMILYFMHKHFPDRDNLVTPIHPLEIEIDREAMANLFNGSDFRQDYKTLNREVRSRGYNIPPLVNAYMSLSPTMRMFGTGINDTFGDVEETGIFLKIEDITEDKKQRHINTYAAH